MLFVLNGNSSASSGSIHVSSYGASPDDSADDTAAIRSAITYAKNNNIATVQFAAGAYDLISSTDGYYVLMVSCKDLTLLGATNAAGAPLTRLLRHLPAQNEPTLKYLMYGRDNTNIVVKNFIFDNTPDAATAGQVVSASGGTVTVDLFDGMARFDNMACYAANAWNTNGTLKEVPSLSFSTSPAQWRTVTGGSGRRMTISGVTFDSYLSAGDHITWYPGVGGNAQTYFLNCKNLTLENLQIVSAANIANLFGAIDNLTLKKIVMRPEGTQRAVTPRDGFHISRCTGNLVIRDCTIEGTRMDGFNIKSMGGAVEAMPSSTQIKFTAASSQSLYSGDLVTFWGGGGWANRTIQSWSYDGTNANGHLYTINLNSNKPSFAAVGTPLSPHSWIQDSILITNVSFSKIAGSAIVLQNMHADIVNSQFTNIMYAPVELGTTLTESCPVKDVTIKGCTFSRSGWQVKSCGKTGLIAVGTANTNLSGSLNNEIFIENNTFKNSVLGIQLAQTKDMTLWSNIFLNVNTTVQTGSSVTGLTYAANEIIADNDSNTNSYVELAGVWNTSTLPGYSGTATRYSSTVGAAVKWTPNLPIAGSYNVYLYKVVHTNADPNAKITIHHAGGDTVQYVNFTSGSSGWISVGTYTFTSGSAGYVKNERQSDACRADSVRFVQAP
jgi:hypothetical protein